MPSHCRSLCACTLYNIYIEENRPGQTVSAPPPPIVPTSPIYFPVLLAAYLPFSSVLPQVCGGLLPGATICVS